MVQSNIAEEINYSETSKLRLSDKDHASCLYIVPLYDQEFLIALGKQITDYAQKGVVFYSIYLLNQKHKIKSRIGVYEADVSIATSLLDEDGDVDLTQLNDPLLFSFVTPDYLDTYGTHGEDLSAKTMTPEELQKEIENEVEVEDTESDEEMEIEIEEEDDDEFFMVVENMPEFPGGDLGLMKYIQRNVRYPAIAKEYNITGKVYVSFIVDKSGVVTNVKIVRGVDKNLDAEALRVVKSLPKYKPGKQRGKAVRVMFTIPINFTLN